MANVETGRQQIPRAFWQRTDAAFGAGGALLAAFDQVDALARDFQAQAAGQREGQRQREQAPQEATTGGQVSRECGCAVAVGRWTGREIRALREALRMSVRVFAEYIGMSPAAVTGWEHRQSPKVPTLATQALLDQALKLADADAQTRFGLILASSDGACDAGTARADTVTCGRSVTAIHRPSRAPAAS